MRFLYTAVLLGFSTISCAQTINQVGFSFSPDEVTVTVGTPITIIIGAPHNATQVSEATWNANGTTPLPGGFAFGAGTHIFTPTVPGTYYFLCTLHPSLMKGRIIVESETGVSDNNAAAAFSVSPNPASEHLIVMADPAMASFVSLIDVQGREVLRRTVKGTDTISIAHLASGDYTVVLLDAQGILREQKRVRIVR